MCSGCRWAAARFDASLHEKAQRTYVIPGTRRTRVAVETMRDWLSLYRTRRVRGAVPEDPRRPRPAPALASRGRRAARLTQDRAARTVGQSAYQSRPRARRRPPARAVDRAPAALARRAARQAPRRPRRHRPATIRLPTRRRAVDERRDARAEGARTPAGAERPTLLHSSTTPPASSPSPPSPTRRTPPRSCPCFKQAIARRGLTARLYVDNGGELPLPAARARVREARHRAHPLPALSARRARKNRTLLPHPARRLAAPPHRRGHREPRGRSTAPCGPGSRASTTSRPIAASTGAPPSTSGPSLATTCATPTPTSTSTTCSCSRPNAA